jgi:hypothetical protein
MEEYELLALLYDALASKLGIAVRVSHFSTASQMLSGARRKCGDPALMSLQFRASPHSDDELWIVRAGEIKLPPDASKGDE